MTRSTDQFMLAPEKSIFAEIAMFLRLSALIVATILIACCHRDGGAIGSKTLPNIRGKFVIEDDHRTTPLTSVEHSIFYVIGAERKLIFRGYGSTAPVLSLLKGDDILIRYCGGSILKIESSFFEDDANVGRILRVQPVTSPGVSANGRSIC